MRKLVYKVSYTLYCTCICTTVLYIEIVLNLSKFKLFDQRIAWKSLFLLVVFLKMIQRCDHNRPLTQITKIFQKKDSTSKSWKLSKVNFSPKSNMSSDPYTTLFNLKLFQNLVILFLMWILKKNWSYNKCQNNEVWNRLVQVID